MEWDFSEEIRNEFIVDTKRKHIWKIEMDLLIQIIEICNKHKIKYFIYAGTLLGAVRHKGFIPWDDDLDVAMLREDYDRFIEITSKEIKEPYFLQTALTDLGHFDGFARLRHDDSTGVIDRDVKKICHNGIFVDIFPLDGITNNIIRKKIQNLKIKIYSGLLYKSVYEDERRSIKGKLINKFVPYIFKIIPFEKMYKRFERCCAEHSNSDEKVEKVGILVCAPNNNHFHWYLEDIEEIETIQYENIKVNAPKGYDRCLKISYGEYTEFPPLSERGKWHSNVYFDPYKSYKEYSEEELEKVWNK